jgi:hypothetical protein
MYAPSEVGVEELGGLSLVARDQVAVAVERDRDGRVPHVRGESLRVHARRDHKRGERVARLVQRNRLEARHSISGRSAERLRSRRPSSSPGSQCSPPDIRGGERPLRARSEDEPLGATGAHPVLDEMLPQDDCDQRQGRPGRPRPPSRRSDGTFEFNANYRERVGLYYDLVKANVQRIVVGLTSELRQHPVVALAVTPGWLRSENMLDNLGVTEETWRDALAERPGFAVSESPAYVGRGVAALAGDANPSRYAGRSLTSSTSRRNTASPTPTALSRTSGATKTGTGSMSRADEESN